MNKLRERGFSAVEGIVVVLILAAVVAAGWFVFNRMNKDDAKKDTATSNTSQTSAPAVNNTKDLDTASDALDQTDLDASTSDSNELDTQTNAF